MSGTISVAATEHAVDTSAVDNDAGIGCNAFVTGGSHVGSIAAAVDILNGVFLAIPHMHCGASRLTRISQRR